MGKTDEPEAAPADAAPEVAPAVAPADIKKDGDAKPGDVEQKADSKSFDGFLSGKKPNGKSRRCTDCLCLILIVAMWVYMTMIGYDNLGKADVQQLLGGLDYKGRICGYDKSVKDNYKWNIVNYYGAGACITECPNVSTWNTFDWYDLDAASTQLVCKDTLNDTAWWASIPIYMIINGDCMFKFASTDYLGFCVIDDMSILTNVFTTYLDTFLDLDDGYSLDAVFESTSLVTTVAGDVWNARYYILMFGFGGSMLCAYLYTYAMRVPIITKTVVWGSIWSVFFFTLGLAGYAHYTVGVYRAEVPQLRSESEITSMQTFSYAFFIGAMSWLCIILYLKDRLTLAIGLIIQTAKALVSMPIIVVIVPIIQVIAYVLFVIPWVLYCVMLASSGEVVVQQTALSDDDGSLQVQYKAMSYSEEQQKEAWFMLFCYFWSAEFIMAAGQIITAMCVCCFYFTRDKSRIGNTTVFTGICLIIRYHMGTIAFGACIVAIVRLIRAYITYLEKYAGGGDTKLKKLILRCLQCFMACIERCIKYINFNAYVQTCIQGTSFCTSAYNAFWLIMRNIARIAAVTGVTHFLGLIGKISVVMGTAGSFYYVMDALYADLVTSIVVPTMLVALLAAAVAIMFFEVFGMGTAVLLQCFIADEEMFKEDPENCFAEGDLRKYLNKNGKSRKKKAEKK